MNGTGNDEILFSIVVCSYNPDDRIFKRCLEAIRLLKEPGGIFEVLLIDNSSAPELTALTYIKDLLGQMPYVRVIVEKQQGLTFARKRGILESTGRYIVFFDDDNEPFDDYLTVLEALWERYPSIGAWGPGNVWVDYIDGIAPNLKKYADPRFQERHEDFIQYSCLRSQQDCYPYGTGLSIKRQHALHYVKLLSSGVLTLKDREGNQLTSGGDMQLVLSCIVQGAAAGVAPALKVKHMITAKRTELSYIRKLIYGTHVCYDPAIRQMIPEHQVNFGRPLKSGTALWFKVMRKYVKVKVSTDIDKKFRFIEWIGLLQSAYLAEGREVPVIIERMTKRLL
ncbi:glycosyltransferase [Niabella hirudinis]|uniref:glycosyltransferase n=1 Tax=Niabella hirudinis TaxID=1285929 RepID=UPI003EBBB53B